MIGLGSDNDILYKLFLFLVWRVKNALCTIYHVLDGICGEMIFQSWQLCDCFERRMSTTSPELIVCRSSRLGRWLSVLEPPRYMGSKDKFSWIVGQCHFNYTKQNLREKIELFNQGWPAILLFSLLSFMHLLKCAPNHLSVVFRFTVTRSPNWPFRCLNCNNWSLSSLKKGVCLCKRHLKSWIVVFEYVEIYGTLLL